jgi:superfamily II DNA or RNA helicase
MKARDSQLEDVAAVRAHFRAGHRFALGQAATGYGKTVMACELIRQLSSTYQEMRVCIIVPKLAIIDSFTKTLSQFMNPNIITIAATSSHGKDLSGQIVIGSYQTLSRINDLPFFDLVIADEAHRINEKDPKSGYYQVIRSLTPNNDTRVLALTATPFRETGYIYGQDKMFKELVFKRDLLWTTEQGITVKAKLVGGNNNTNFDISSLTIDNTGEYSQGSLAQLSQNESKARAQVDDLLNRSYDLRKIAIACTNIEHAMLIHSLLIKRGQKAQLIHSEQDWDDRMQSLGDFQTDPQVRFLVFISIVAEGFDFPPIDCIVLLRPTRRANLYVQCVGRGLRTSPGKTYCLVLDYGKVVENCGPLNAPFVSDGGRKGLEKVKAASDVDIIQCLCCGAFFFPSIHAENPQCPHCGKVHERPAKKNNSLQKEAATDGLLYDLDASVNKKKRAKRENKTFTLDYVNWKPCGSTDISRRQWKIIEMWSKEEPRWPYKVFVPNARWKDGRQRWQLEEAKRVEPELESFMNAVSPDFDIANINTIVVIRPKTLFRVVLSVSTDGKNVGRLISFYPLIQEEIDALNLPKDNEDEALNAARRAFGFEHVGRKGYDVNGESGEWEGEGT